MARQRFRRKDLKRPDQFVSTGQRFLVWCAENRTQLVRGTVAVVAVLVLGAGYGALRTSRAAQANTDLGRALRPIGSGDYNAAAAKLANVAERWSSTDAGRLAPLYAASAALNAGNAEEAQRTLDLVSVSGLPPYLRQQLPLLQGFVQKQTGELAGAAERFKNAAESDGPYTAVALLAEARTREALGESEQARALYERLVQEFPQAPGIDLAKAKIEALAG